MVAAIIFGVVIIAGIVAFNVWARRYPMTPEQREEFEQDVHAGW